MLKFELPNLLPKTEKLLYLDSDIIIKKDISPIFSIDISEYYMAAVVEYWDYYDILRYHFGCLRDETFNAGFMLYNVPKMRRDGIPAALWARKKSEKSFLMDQSCLNMVVGKSFYHLPLRYNYNPMFLGAFYVPHFNRIYHGNYGSIQAVVDGAVVVHYMCYGAKPWIFKDVAMGNLWIEEYMRLGNNPEVLPLKNVSCRDLPEFCKWNTDLRLGRYHSLRFIHYIFFVLLHWNYYQKLIKKRK